MPNFATFFGYFLFYFLVFYICYVSCRSDGLVQRPPMGWLAWTKFMCQIDCDKHPKACISEQLFIDMVEVLVSDGYLDAGYDRINIDDCWMARDRTSDGELQADAKRFPHGIKWLADYMHSRGIKLGIYTSIGKKTCMGFPGSVDDLERDAKTFMQWDIDMLKLDGCFTDPKVLDAGYPEMSRYLNGTKIVYSCSWPYYISTVAKIEPDHELVKHHCHLWRNFDDIQISFASVARIIGFYDHNQDKFVPLHGPGAWNDPDMIIIGNPELSASQARVQMALWCIWSAPLLMSNDLRSVPAEHKEILQNQRLIAINQDKLGIMGKLVHRHQTVNVYVKPVTPLSRTATNSDHITADVSSFAIAFYNRDSRIPVDVSVKLEALGLKYRLGYDVEDLFSRSDLGLLLPDDTMSVRVAPHDAIVYKATIKDGRQVLSEEQQPSNDVLLSSKVAALSLWDLIRAVMLCLLFAYVLRRTLKFVRRKWRL